MTYAASVLLRFDGFTTQALWPTTILFHLLQRRWCPYKGGGALATALLRSCRLCRDWQPIFDATYRKRRFMKALMVFAPKRVDTLSGRRDSHELGYEKLAQHHWVERAFMRPKGQPEDVRLQMQDV